MRRLVILWLCILTTTLTFAQRSRGWSQSNSFTLNYDSVKITIQSSPNKLVIINQIDCRKRVLTTEYLINNKNIAYAKTALKHPNDPKNVIDSNLYEVDELRQSKARSTKWKTEDIEIKLKLMDGVLYTTLSFNGSHNVFELKYFFDSSCLVMLTAQDKSKRYNDSISAANKRVKFTTIIDQNLKVQKHQCKINGYVVPLESEELEKIKGKRVKIKGLITLNPGTFSPNSNQMYSPDGTRTMAGGYGSDTKWIYNRKIKILKD
jgi:hypothetical protein